MSKERLEYTIQISTWYGRINSMQLDGLMLTKNVFSKMIEETVITKKLSYIDAVVHLCEKNNIEIEDTKKYISNVIKNKIEAEAQKLNFIPTKPKGNELPI